MLCTTCSITTSIFSPSGNPCVHHSSTYQSSATFRLKNLRPLKPKAKRWVSATSNPVPSCAVHITPTNKLTEPQIVQSDYEGSGVQGTSSPASFKSLAAAGGEPKTNCLR